MTDTGELAERNADFAADRFVPGLRINPSGNLMVVGCVDPRVDPAHVLGLRHGEAAVIRNVGGRITPATLQMMAMLGMIDQVEGANPGSGWNLVILHHTDCGITRLVGRPDLLAEHFCVLPDQLEAKAVADPRAAVAADVAALKEAAFLPGGFVVSGFVYDVATGLLDPVVAPSPLHGDEGRLA